MLLGRELRHGGWGGVRRIRFFRKGSGKYSEDIVHESFVTKESIGLLKGFISHYTYRDIAHHIEKTNIYTSMMAEKLSRQGKNSGSLKIVVKPAFQFLKSYLLRRGFLDGIPGFYAAVSASFYTFLKYMKLWELNKIQK